MRLSARAETVRFVSASLGTHVLAVPDGVQVDLLRHLKGDIDLRASDRRVAAREDARRS